MNIFSLQASDSIIRERFASMFACIEFVKYEKATFEHEIFLLSFVAVGSPHFPFVLWMWSGRDEAHRRYCSIPRFNLVCFCSSHFPALRIIMAEMIFCFNVHDFLSTTEKFLLPFVTMTCKMHYILCHSLCRHIS